VDIERTLFEIGALDQMALQDTPLHRLDPRTKLITAMGFILTVVSFGRYELAALLPLTLYPVALAAMGDLPAGYLLRKLLIASPFALFVGMFNPLLDRTPLLFIGSVAVSGGWISFLSILTRFCLTVSAALILVGSTGFSPVCMALGRLGMPRIFAAQLLFLYRYIFVLTEEGLRMVRARNLRSFGNKGTGVRIYGHMLGQLLLRTMDRAQRIHQAMLCRGFDGEVRLVRHCRFTSTDVAFIAGWFVYFGLARAFNLPQILGGVVTRIMA
jgi:cobalt/nickel transport system permease protein